MQTPENLDVLSSAKSVPTSDETPVIRDGKRLVRVVTRQHVASVTIPVCVRGKRGSLIGVLVQECLEIRVIIIVLALLHDCDAIERDVILNEQCVEEDIFHAV